MWGLSVVVAVLMIVFVWSPSGPDGDRGGVWFAILFSAFVAAIVLVNFRTLWLGQGRRAQAMEQSIERRGSAR